MKQPWILRVKLFQQRHSYVTTIDRCGYFLLQFLKLVSKDHHHCHIEKKSTTSTKFAQGLLYRFPGSPIYLQQDQEISHILAASQPSRTAFLWTTPTWSLHSIVGRYANVPRGNLLVGTQQQDKPLTLSDNAHFVYRGKEEKHSGLVCACDPYETTHQHQV